jgi:hypothetical protein
MMGNMDNTDASVANMANDEANMEDVNILPDSTNINVANNNGSRLIAATMAVIPPNITINDDVRVLVAIADAIPPDNRNNNDQNKMIRLLTVPVSDCRSGLQDQLNNDPARRKQACKNKRRIGGYVSW